MDFIIGAENGFHRNGGIRVLLAASDTPWIRALAGDLGTGFVVCGVEETAQRAIAAVVAEEPDVCLVTDDLEGAALVTAKVAQIAPRTKVIVIADCVDPDECLAYLLAGAAGYVARETRGSALAAAVRDVVAGLAIVPPRAQRRLLDELLA